ncbi:hypothetical protein HGRIS_006736 [Hohenbuehelia grisea]|uniref:Uncharacterized protein n=1 Tax=Hohenbuehelia grisea TaxID=104357 RepID=A0ABR3JAF7_9AGAR
MPRFIAPPPVDLSTRVTEIAAALGSLNNFMAATRELLTCSALPAAEFLKSSRKIVALIEIARSTLTAAGLSLYSFAYCPSEYASYKEVYFELLRMLDAHKEHISDGLQGRTVRLLSLLYPHCVIKRGYGSAERCARRVVAHGPAPRARHGSSPSRRAPYSGAGSVITSLSISSTMPPPDAFPALLAPAKRHTIQRCSPARALDVSTETSESLASMAGREQATEPNEDPEPLVIRPRSNRFGIFCTPKRSMHQRRERFQQGERLGRSPTIRPIQQE